MATASQTGQIEDFQVQGKVTVLTLKTDDSSMLVYTYGKLAASASEFVGIQVLVSGNIEVTERRLSLKAGAIVPMMEGVGVSQMTICGRLGSDPEMKTLKGDMVIAKFALATNSYGKDKPNWFQCTAWGKKAELVSKFCKKGSVLGVTGNLSVNKWTSKKDGSDQTSHEVNVKDVFLMPRLMSGAGENNALAPSYSSFVPSNAQASFVPATTVNSQEIPF